MHRHVLWIPILFAFGLPAAAATEVERYLPLPTGQELRYETLKTRSYILTDREVLQEIEGTAFQVVVGPSNEVAAATQEVPVILLATEETETNTSTDETTTSRARTYLTAEPHQVLMIAQGVEGLPGVDPEVVLLDEAVAVLKLPLPAAGEAYPSRLEAHGMVFDSRPYARETETVTTPAGTFEDCLKLSSRGTVTGALPGEHGPQEIHGGKIEETLWFAPDIGIVKEVIELEMVIEIAPDQPLTARERKVKVLTSQSPPTAGASESP